MITSMIKCEVRICIDDDMLSFNDNVFLFVLFSRLK